MITAKYPIDKKCLILNSTNRKALEKKFGKPFHKLKEYKHNDSVRSSGLYEFIEKKIGKLAYPSYACYQSMDDYHRKRYEVMGQKYDFPPTFHIENACIIELPISYDSSHDLADAMERKMNFLETMKRSLGEKYNEENFEKYVDFGSFDFSYINDLLSFFYSEFKDHYSSTGFLPIFIDYKDEESSSNTGMIEYPFPKAFFLSEIESHLRTNYNVDTEELYFGLQDDLYIEGRYWERYFECQFAETNFQEKPVSDNFKAMVNLVWEDFEDHFILTERNDENYVLPVYFDYYKHNPLMDKED